MAAWDLFRSWLPVGRGSPLYQHEDNAPHDLTVHGARRWNARIHHFPHTFYLSFFGDVWEPKQPRPLLPGQGPLRAVTSEWALAAIALKDGPDMRPEHFGPFYGSRGFESSMFGKELCRGDGLIEAWTQQFPFHFGSQPFAPVTQCEKCNTWFEALWRAGDEARNDPY
jgi:hypothetical protein